NKPLKPSGESSDTAIPFTPVITASIAAVTVPEYVISCPMFACGLIPETTKATFSSMNPSKANATQSEGAPSGVKAGVPSERSISRTRRGRSIVFACPEADQYLSGARIVTLPRFFNSSARADNPGAVTPSSFVTKICIFQCPIHDYYTACVKYPFYIPKINRQNQAF